MGDRTALDEGLQEIDTQGGTLEFGDMMYVICLLTYVSLIDIISRKRNKRPKYSVYQDDYNGELTKHRWAVTKSRKLLEAEADVSTKDRCEK
jgi:hypothetical protein